MIDDSPFKIALKTDLEIITQADGLAVRQTIPSSLDSHPEVKFSNNTPWMSEVVERLKFGVLVRDLLSEVELTHGQAAASSLVLDLGRLNQEGWISYQADDLVLAVPLNTRPEFRSWKIVLQERAVPVQLSRFAYMRVYAGRPVIESPLTKFRITILDNRLGALIAAIAEPVPSGLLNGMLGLTKNEVENVLGLLTMTGLIDSGAPSRSLELWEFHNLLFHAYSRIGRHDYPPRYTTKDSCVDDNYYFPVLKKAMGKHVIVLPKPNLDELVSRDSPLASVMEARRSYRNQDELKPITIEQLGEFLYRTARVTSVFRIDDKAVADEFAEYPEDLRQHVKELLQSDQFTNRSYPSGGGLYELEIYPLVRLCKGLDLGLYHYDPLNHLLEQLDVPQDEVKAFAQNYGTFLMASESSPQVCFIISARFGRIFKKYRSVGYSLILKHVGTLYQNFYLAATAMGLAPCVVGSGDVEMFGRLTGLPFEEESSVGEFLLGSKGTDSIFPPRLEPRPKSPALNGIKSSATRSAAAPHCNDVLGHDLELRLPGLAELRAATLGDPSVTVVILDGDPDTSIASLQNPMLSRVTPYWQPTLRSIGREEYVHYQQILTNFASKEERALAIQASFGDDMLAQISFNTHATAVTSVIAGLPGSDAPGLAPRCRVINLPITANGDVGEFMSSLNLTRAIEFALELGANVIHCAVCQPTQSGQIDAMLARAIEKCLQLGVVIVTPVGNEKGECSCIPAIAPGVLAVGALDVDGTPMGYSNWGELYERGGIMAPGKEILCAQPGTGDPIRKEGTSLAAPVVTGLVSLLISWLRVQGKAVDGQEVAAALRDTALPCSQDSIEGPARCLSGILNLPATMYKLSGKPVPPTEATTVHVQPSIPVHVSAAGVKANTAFSGYVFALGRVGYHFLNERARDDFASRMADGGIGSRASNPSVPAQVIAHLMVHPSDAQRLVWTLESDNGPIYALIPEGVNASEIYNVLVGLLEGQYQPSPNALPIERVSLPGHNRGRRVKLLNGQTTPVIHLLDTRGVYSWNVAALIDEAMAHASITLDRCGIDRLQQVLTNFLNRVYHDLNSLGQTSRDRALNFAVTNIYQVTSVFLEALKEGRTFAGVKIEKSPFCRLQSDCWDVILDFVDPENPERAIKVFRFTIDVSDIMPVTIGQLKSWFVPNS